MGEQRRAAVIGGGPAGLAAAIGLAERGAVVTLIEQADELGGRARSERHVIDGAWIGTANLGPHALYPTAERMLAELGVSVRGGVPTEGLTLQLEGRLAALPAGPAALLSHPWLDLRDKLALGTLFARLDRMDLAPLASVPLTEWMERRGLSRAARRVLLALVRVSTYTHAPERIGAGFALAQLRAGAAGVRYLDEGWASLVRGLRERAEALGVTVRCGVSARSIHVREGRVCAVGRGDDEPPLEADRVVLAASPRRAAALLGAHLSEELGAQIEAMSPVRAACLDVALERLPRRHGAYRNPRSLV